MIRAVLFDLDDTLFDHRASSAEALRRVQSTYEYFRGTPFSEFEQTHSNLLEAMHLDVVSGRIGMDEARCERFRRLFESFNVKPSDEMCSAAARQYRSEYLAARRAIVGAEALLEAIRQRARVAIVSNNMLEEQKEKLAFCRLAAHVDVLVVSEEAGVSKPEPEIFRIALDRMGARPEDAVMVGDSWEADVVGARRSGIRAVWFNPQRRPAPDPSHRVPELHAFVPTDSALSVVLD
jgi:YjjG family noncanonical pyrimidine nucleotidase